MKKYHFPVVIEPDDGQWSAYVPGMVDKGATAWGNTKEEAMKHIQEVAQMIFEELIEEGQSLPPYVTEPEQEVITVSV